MSYKDMPHNYSDISEHMEEGIKELTALFMFFQSLKAAFDNFSGELNKVSDNFQLLKPESSLSKAMHSLKKLAKQIITNQLSFINSLQSEIIEPLDLFAEHFKSNNQEISTKVENLLKPLKTSQYDLSKIRNLYYLHSEKLEKLNRTVINFSNQQQIITQKRNFERSSSAYQENYKKYVEEVNIYNAIYESGVPSIMESLQQNEESRIHFIKSSTEKYIRFFHKLLESQMACLLEFSEGLSFVNSSFDIKNFVGRLEHPMVTQENFIDYDTWKSQKKVEELTDADIINSVIDQLILNKPGKLVDYSKLDEILAKNKGKDMFIQGLELFKQEAQLTCEGFYKLGDILKNLMLTLEDDENSQMYFCKIIALSHVFYSEIRGIRHYLTDVLKGEKIWDNERRWINAIKLAINAKLLVDKESSQKANNKKKTGFIFSTLKDLAQKIPLAMKEKPIERADKSSAYNILSQFTYQMSNLSVSSKIAHLIIMKMADTYELESDRICTLLSQVQVEHSKEPEKIKALGISKEKIFKFSVEFFTIRDSLEVLCINKSFNQKLSPYILHNFLLKNVGNTEKIRKTHWINMLKSHFPRIDYFAFLEKVKKSPELIGEIDEIIDMDVSRSYQENTEIHQSLKNVLKTYAFYNPDVSYCQGMNFIAGTFLMLLKDEELSFSCLIGLVKKFHMDPLFQVGVPKLRCMLYQLDQLIEIKLPNVQKAFKLEGVSAGFFSSSWFLTIFSSNLQGRVEVLHQIWDYFFIKGWKVMFQAAIAILKIMENKISRASFDDIMGLVSGGNLLAEDIFNENFIYKIKKVKLSNLLLLRLEKDYDDIVHLSTRSSNL